MRILKPDGSLVIYEPLPAERKSDTQLTYSERISRLKLYGFIVKDIEQKSLDKDLESKNFLPDIYRNAEDICKILASKPSFEVSYILVLYLIQQKKSFF